MKNLRKAILKSKMVRDAKKSPVTEWSRCFFHKNNRLKNYWKAKKMLSLANTRALRKKRLMNK